MKTDFLKSLGIEDEKIIEAIHAENGKDIDNVRRQMQSVENERNSLKTQLEERDNQLSDLKKNSKNNAELTARIEELERENKQSKETHESELAALKKNSAVELALLGDKVKNVKALKPFLNMDNIKLENETLVGYKEQIDKLRADETTAFLFEAVESSVPTGTKPGGGSSSNVPNSSQPTSFAQAVANALGNKK